MSKNSLPKKSAAKKSAAKTAADPWRTFYRRHEDDETYDCLVIRASSVLFEAKIVPRLKSSGISGDGWRLSWACRLVVSGRSADLSQDSHHTLGDTVAHLPILLNEVADRRSIELRACTGGSVALFRKGTELGRRYYVDLGAALDSLPWLLRTHLECLDPQETQRWYERIELDKKTCHQPGCARPATVLCQMKKYGSKSGEFVVPVPPDYRYLRAFCAAHSTRGDCDLTDQDKNYTVVSGTRSPPNEGDVSPAVFGGVVDASGPGSLGAQ